mmetsp:Transcript_7266/g.11150  ORF Transcript_7266/g.11150 Transcript_7266/m.11150 type:complete len:545 (-) Transcript_7266:133-1767(-)
MMLLMMMMKRMKKMVLMRMLLLVIVVLQSSCMAQETMILTIEDGESPRFHRGIQAIYGAPYRANRLYNINLYLAPVDDPHLCRVHFDDDIRRNRNIRRRQRRRSRRGMRRRSLQQHWGWRHEAILVPSNPSACSYETQIMAVNAMPHVSHLILYDDNNEQNNNAAKTIRGDPSIHTVGVTYIGTESGKNIVDRMNSISSKEHVSPHYGQDAFTATRWSFSASLEEISPNGNTNDEGEDDQGFYVDDGRFSSNTRSNRESFVLPWLYLFIPVILMLPCLRTITLWTQGGGRLRWRRNVNGRITGIRILRPVPYWWAVVMSSTNDNQDGNANNRNKKLTKQQVENLPLVVYNGNNHHTDGNNDDNNNNDDDDDDKEKVEEEEEESKHAQNDNNDDNEEPTVCSICIDEFLIGEKLRKLPRCGHLFHTECIMPWLTERNACCPLCKVNVLEGDDEDDSGNNNITININNTNEEQPQQQQQQQQQAAAQQQQQQVQQQQQAAQQQQVDAQNQAQQPSPGQPQTVQLVHAPPGTTWNPGAAYSIPHGAP